MKMFSRLDAEQLRLAPRRLQLLALAEIGREGHDLAAIGGLQPLQDDRGVEAAGIGEHDLVDALVGHGVGLASWMGGHRPNGRRSYGGWRRLSSGAARPAQPPSHPARSLRCGDAAAARRAAALAARAKPERFIGSRRFTMPRRPGPRVLVRVRLHLFLSRRHAHRGRWPRRRGSTCAGGRSCSGRSSRRRAGPPRRSTSIPAKGRYMWRDMEREAARARAAAAAGPTRSRRTACSPPASRYLGADHAWRAGLHEGGLPGRIRRGPARSPSRRAIAGDPRPARPRRRRTS